jgi:hypothetical protein
VPTRRASPEEPLALLSRRYVGGDIDEGTYQGMNSELGVRPFAQPGVRTSTGAADSTGTCGNRVL